MLLSHKKNEIIPFAATWMDLEILIVSEVSQTEKDKYHDTTCTWVLKNDISISSVQLLSRVRPFATP